MYYFTKNFTTFKDGIRELTSIYFTKNFKTFKEGLREISTISKSVHKALNNRVIMMNYDDKTILNMALRILAVNAGRKHNGDWDTVMHISATSVSYTTPSGVLFGWARPMNKKQSWKFVITNLQYQDEGFPPSAKLVKSANKYGWLYHDDTKV